jgi:hypothetical protein
MIMNPNQKVHVFFFHWLSCLSSFRSLDDDDPMSSPILVDWARRCFTWLIWEKKEAVCICIKFPCHRRRPVELLTCRRNQRGVFRVVWEFNISNLFFLFNFSRVIRNFLFFLSSRVIASILFLLRLDTTLSLSWTAVASERIISSFNLLLLLQRVNDSCLLEAFWW